ncbi:F-box/kelch-repeat protein At3g23880-like [Vicia villosa]|uniref:F-box/kelch-repeat protein At3g23880-like n=1 Tax=Vicia villosa TaxID=3911 RepID=UPI00273A85C4|nr:F-box/kelch-repeat protein At3g23880-like [Vicia villosa]
MSKIPSPTFFPDDIITEIISLLPVKPLLRFQCVSNSWNTLISDPSFVKFHLKRSKASPNQLFTLITNHFTPVEGKKCYYSDWSVVPYPISSLFENPPTTFDGYSRYFLNEKDYHHSRIVGSCNGLICLAHHDLTSTHEEYWFRLWNPATRKISKRIGYSHHPRLAFVFNFGCDDSTCTFKVVASCYTRDEYTSEVKVLTVGDNVWRNIESFPVVPFGINHRQDDCVFLNSSLNWLAIHKDIQNYLHDEFAQYYYDIWATFIRDYTIEDLAIVSLDLRTETYNQYLLPQGFDKLPPVEPTVSVLGECLCFSYFQLETDMVIWQMKKFGVEESWFQFLKISYHVLQLYYNFSYNHPRLLPLLLSKDGDSLILCTTTGGGEEIIYNSKDNSVQRIVVNVKKTITDDESCNVLYLHLAQGYVESLISIC